MYERTYKRGEIYYISKGAPNYGSEQEAGRPAIIVSNDVGNTYSPVVEVVYLTTQPKNDMPTHVKIRSCKEISTALCEQITTVYTDRIGSYMCSCTDEEMDLVDQALKISLGLKDDYCEFDQDEQYDEYEEDEDNELLKKLQVLETQVITLTAQRDTYREMFYDMMDRIRNQSI